MKTVDIIILSAIAVWGVIALVYLFKNRKKGGCCGSGCTGDCKTCGLHCQNKKSNENERKDGKDDQI